MRLRSPPRNDGHRRRRSGHQAERLDPVFTSFTSICTLAPYADYGYRPGEKSRFQNVSGGINAVEPKRGVWNLDVSFAGLQPSASYALCATRPRHPPSPATASASARIGTVVADVDGASVFTYRTTDPENLGFGLNLNRYTIVTS
jgi:hypothetical protein